MVIDTDLPVLEIVSGRSELRYCHSTPATIFAGSEGDSVGSYQNAGNQWRTGPVRTSSAGCKWLLFEFWAAHLPTKTLVCVVQSQVAVLSLRNLLVQA